MSASNEVYVSLDREDFRGLIRGDSLRKMGSRHGEPARSITVVLALVDIGYAAMVVELQEAMAAVARPVSEALAELPPVTHSDGTPVDPQPGGFDGI